MTSSAILVAWSAIRSMCRTAEKQFKAGCTRLDWLCMMSQILSMITRLYDAAGGDRVEVHQRIHRSADDLRGERHHPPQVVGDLEFGIRFHGLGPLRNADGQVGDALQVVVDLHQRRDPPQIDRHWLMEGENLQALFLDVDFVRIDVGVGRNHAFDQVVPSLGEGLSGVVDHFLDDGRNAQELGIEAFDVAKEVSAHGLGCWEMNGG